MYSPPRDSVHLLDMQECLNEEKEPEPDAALLRWAEWIKTRKAIFQNLSSKTGQEPKCLAENVNKTYRQMLDQKLVEEAGKYMTPDKYRGHPDWYKTVQPKSNCLKKKCISELVYPADVKFTEDPNVVRNKCYFGVPKAIQAEQGIIGHCSEKEKDRVWQKNVYLASRKEELRENWEILETFRPDIDSLYVKDLRPSERQPMELFGDESPQYRGGSWPQLRGYHQIFGPVEPPRGRIDASAERRENGKNETKEQGRNVYKSMLEAYVKDLLSITIDRICATVDTINAVEAGKQFDMDVPLVAYRRHYERPTHIPVLPSLF
ncbi:unnamed protein product [Nesidiocoris tenuis]|uniref:Uncharacterized protein n=1 Tax=Nesidiocoris tenuis TaxID=355587 RepID=A0A6H5HAJ2_9HEMI|nr:unnamed protein product [Nesidiocoris tenuis]